MRPFIPRGIPSSMRSLVTDCWESDQEVRLDIRSALERIGELCEDKQFLSEMGAFLEIKHSWIDEVKEVKIQEGRLPYEESVLQCVQKFWSGAEIWSFLRFLE